MFYMLTPFGIKPLISNNFQLKQHCMVKTETVVKRSFKLVSNFTK